jgi:hypothetical protein
MKLYFSQPGEKTKIGRGPFHLCGSRRNGKSEVIPVFEF